MLPKLVKYILKEEAQGQEVTVFGWVRTKRDMKNLVFVEIYDGSCFAGIQCAFNNPDPKTENTLASLTTGASVKITGALVPSPASGQDMEITASELVVLGDAPAQTIEGETPDLAIQAYPLQKKRHSMEFLRQIAHLRPRTNTFGAIARLRSRLSFAIHRYFQERDFHYLHTPVITAGDCEGAGSMFQVTTLNPVLNGKEIDYSKDFFGKKTFLTVSGQLEGETYATAISRIYTFGPTFRAENSNTVRHLAEFWMIEPEVAFAGLDDNMALAEDFLKYIFNAALNECADELAFFDNHVEKGIIENLQRLADAKFARITYTDAVKELEKASSANNSLFEFKPHWGCDLQSEHEKFLTEKIACSPVIVTDYPKEIKAFYMKLNDDGKTVRAMDVLVPRLGEIIGGSQREDDLEKLICRMKEMKLNIKDYDWYLDLRRYGTVVHSGFGLGFERLIQYISGMANIRDVIPFPRAAGQAEF